MMKNTPGLLSTTWLQDMAKVLSKNPLRIIALFIVLVYGFASMITMFNTGLTEGERLPLIYFLVLFPVLVLAVFAWLVCKHSEKLYGPSDYKNEENYIRMQLAAAASLAAAAANDQNDEDHDINLIIEAVHRLEAHQGVNKPVLWVDDDPKRHVYIRKAFEALGISFYLATSIHQALDALDEQSFAAIIADINKSKGPRGGYILLDAIRKQGDPTPFFMYTGHQLLPEEKQEAVARGALASTGKPKELFELVTDSLLKKAGR